MAAALVTDESSTESLILHPSFSREPLTKAITSAVSVQRSGVLFAVPVNAEPDAAKVGALFGAVFAPTEKKGIGDE